MRRVSIAVVVLLLSTMPASSQDHALRGHWEFRAPTASPDYRAVMLVDAAGAGPQPFWKAGLKVVDTRLNPEELVESEISFPGDAHQVRVRLIYRRFWAEVAKEKSWPDEDIVVFDQTLTR